MTHSKLAWQVVGRSQNIPRRKYPLHLETQPQVTEGSPIHWNRTPGERWSVRPWQSTKCGAEHRDLGPIQDRDGAAGVRSNAFASAWKSTKIKEICMRDIK